MAPNPLDEPTRNGRRSAGPVVLVLVVFVLAGWQAWPLLRAADDGDLAAAKETSASNLKELGLAMHNYYDAHGAFPTHAVYSRDGKPLLSWRVLLLPFLNEQELYGEFRLDEPWDSPHNKKLLARMPRVFLPVRGKPKQPYSTYFQVFVGKSALFEGQQKRTFADVRDGLANTFMIVEGGEAVPWSKPEDIAYDPDKPLPKLGGLFDDGFHAAYCDGRVLFVEKTVGERVLRARITHAGRESVP
jgi:Protein of unknown function (DUF1559)